MSGCMQDITFDHPGGSFHHILVKFWWAFGQWVLCGWSWLPPMELQKFHLAAFFLLLGSCTWQWSFPNQIFCFQETFHCVTIYEAFYYLISNILLGAFIGANLYIFDSSQRATRKSLKDSPGCWVWRQKFQRSTDSLMLLSTYCCMALTISLMLPLWASLRPMFSTIVRVSQDKHSIRAWTCFVCACLSSPERLRYAFH